MAELMLAGAVRAGNDVISGLKTKSATHGMRQRRKNACRSVCTCSGDTLGSGAELPSEARYAASVCVGAGATYAMAVGVGARTGTGNGGVGDEVVPACGQSLRRGNLRRRGGGLQCIESISTVQYSMS